MAPRSLLLAAAAWSVLAAPWVQAATSADVHFECLTGGAGRSREPCASYAFTYRAEWSMHGLRQPGEDELAGKTDQAAAASSSERSAMLRDSL